MKITPAHDPNDFLAAKRNNLPAIHVIDGEGKMTHAAGSYSGLDRFEARKKVIEDLESQGFLIKKEKHQFALAHCDRCNTIVEPLLSLQWFARMTALAEPAIKAVEERRTRFVPENWEKTFFEWMRNIRDWCISASCGGDIKFRRGIAMRVVKRLLKWKRRSLVRSVVLKNFGQETDVLDTWFSSGLWPMSVFGWPEITDDLKYYYPTNVL